MQRQEPLQPFTDTTRYVVQKTGSASGPFELGTQIILPSPLAFLECCVKWHHEKVPAIVCFGLSPKVFLQVWDGGLAPEFPITAVNFSADCQPETKGYQ